MPGHPPIQYITRATWANGFLSALGNNAPSQGTINFVEAWGIAEGGRWGASGSGCGAFNMLNTEQNWANSTTCNSAGVRSYATLQDGVQANASVVLGGNYPNLLRALQTNDENSLGVNGQMSSGVAQDLSMWTTGQRSPINNSYVSNILNALHNPSQLSGGGQISGSTTGVQSLMPGGSGTVCDTPVVGGLICFLQTNIVSWGEHIAIFMIALIMIIMGLILMGEKHAVQLANSTKGLVVAG